MHDRIPLYLIMPVAYAVILVLVMAGAWLRKKYNSKPTSVAITRDRDNHERIY